MPQNLFKFKAIELKFSQEYDYTMNTTIFDWYCIRLE